MDSRTGWGGAAEAAVGTDPALGRAVESIRAAALEVERAQAVAARLVAAAEGRLREVVGEHTADGSISAEQAEALLADGGAAGRGPCGGDDAWGRSGGGQNTVPGPRSDQARTDLGRAFAPDSEPIDLQPVDRLLSLFATRLPSRDEIQY